MRSIIHSVSSFLVPPFGRVNNGPNTIDTTNRLGRTTKCKKVKKRDEWVKYLLDKAKTTEENDTVDMMFEVMIKMIKTKVYTDKDVIQRIVIVTTNPNDRWATAKKGDIYMIPGSYFT